MNHVLTKLVFSAAAFAVVGTSALVAETHKRASAPIIITPPAVQDGSSFSRAPFPAARWQNDVTPPNGEAFDQSLPPNTPSTTPAPVAPPVPTLAIFQPKVAPGLMPTGRPSTAAGATLDASRMQAAIRATPYEGRENLVDTLRVRERDSEATLLEFRRTEGEMSAGGREQFGAKADLVREQRKSLDKSLRSADDASRDNWEQAREQLASSYSAYASAVAEVDATVGVVPARQ